MGNGVTLFSLLAALFLAALILMPSAAAALLNPASQGFGGQTRSANYDALIDALYANGNATTVIGDKLWVPWYTSATSCQVSDLQQGGNCNSGETIDATHNCMVTDEFSQVGVLVAMGDDQSRMDQFYNTVAATASTHGQLPGWRIYRSGNAIQQCRSGINGNCDTASDADARIIISLYTASDNALFGNGQRRALYHELATNLSRDFVANEVLYSCKQSSLGYGDICWWLAAGSGARSGGMASTDFGYSGYYADAIIAMLQACGQTGNRTYCQIAGNFTLNYLQAAKFDGTHFTVPPGRSFAWTNLSGIPAASCTNTCNPDRWDSADAPRALGMCQANYYSQRMNIAQPGLQAYCDAWGNRYMTSSESAPLQYHSDGTTSGSSQSGFFAQGLEALFQSGGHNPSLFGPTIDSALSHYSTTTRTFDWTACFGVYTEAFSMRALGMGIGRDEAGFTPLAGPGQDATAPPDQDPAPGPIPEPTPAPTPSPANTSGGEMPNSTNAPGEAPSVMQNISFLSLTPESPAGMAEPDNRTFAYSLSNPDGLQTTTAWFLNGIYQPSAFNSNAFLFIGNYSAAGVWNVSVSVLSAQNTISHDFLLAVSDTPAASPAPAQNGAPAETPVPTPLADATNGTQGADANVTQNATPDIGQNLTNLTQDTTAGLPNTSLPNTSTVLLSPAYHGGGGAGGGFFMKPAKKNDSANATGSSSGKPSPQANPSKQDPAAPTLRQQTAAQSTPVRESPAPLPEIVSTAEPAGYARTLSVTKQKLSLLLVAAILLACLALVYAIETSSRHVMKRTFGHYTARFAQHVAAHGRQHIGRAARSLHAKSCHVIAQLAAKRAHAQTRGEAALPASALH